MDYGGRYSFSCGQGVKEVITAFTRSQGYSFGHSKNGFENGSTGDRAKCCAPSASASAIALSAFAAAAAASKSFPPSLLPQPQPWSEKMTMISTRLHEVFRRWPFDFPSSQRNLQFTGEHFQTIKQLRFIGRAIIMTTLLKVHVRGGLFEKSRDLLIELDTLGFAKKELINVFIDGCLAKNGRIGEKENVMRIMRKMDEITMHRKGHQPMEDNAELISKAAIKEFASSFVKLVNPMPTHYIENGSKLELPDLDQLPILIPQELMVRIHDPDK
uniref:Uncharacterized protein n=1 Tax=Salix viminalis TaxID=40686 RepID=A0A6N2MDP3_SALVM